MNNTIYTMPPPDSQYLEYILDPQYSGKSFKSALIERSNSVPPISDNNMRQNILFILLMIVVYAVGGVVGYLAVDVLFSLFPSL